MAVVNLKGSKVMTGLDARPVQKADVSRCGGRIRYWADTVEVGAADSAASTYLLARLPSNAVITPLSNLHYDDLASSGSPTADVGVFNQEGKTAITDDDNLLADGVDVTAAGSTGLNQDIANFGKQLWELLGLTKDPGVDLDIKVTLKDAAVDVGGTVSIELYYTVD